VATRVSLTKILMTQFDWPTPKPPVRCKKSGTYLKCKLSKTLIIGIKNSLKEMESFQTNTRM